ncbi:MAG: hypothetical protein OIF56_09575 [Cohaesibacter sp.]|nr:hypothetical protein [Cohaesibacter sp.]
MRERDTAFLLEKAGYKIHQQPKITDAEAKADGLKKDKKPDFRINGKIYDNYAPTTDRVRNIWTYILEEKIQEGQTKRVVLNLTDSPVTIAEVLQQFKQYPMEELLDLIIIK